MYITENSDLLRFVNSAKNSDVLAVDTEFLREKTYWPKLCLLQLGTRDEQVAIDPFAIKDLSPLIDLFTDEHITKIFHAGYQDLEIINKELGILPTPIFDTQIAATLLGNTLQISYGALVQSVCGVKLRKADSFTDWSRRPLSASQLDYALDDVVYLPSIFDAMRAELEAKGRLSWLDKDFKALVEPERYRVDAYARFMKLKRVNSLSRRQLSAARELAAWRETKAMDRNIPRKWVLSDEQIVEVCKREPKTIDDLFMVRGVREGLNMGDARRALEACQRGLSKPESEWPSLPSSGPHEANVDSQVDLMSSLVRLRARQNNIAFGVLASHEELQSIARGHREGCELLMGWRYELIGRELIDLCEGRIAISIVNGNLHVSRI